MERQPPPTEREDVPMPEESTERGPLRFPADDTATHAANDDPGSDDFEDVDGDLETDTEPNPDGQR